MARRRRPPPLLAVILAATFAVAAASRGGFLSDGAGISGDAGAQPAAAGFLRLPTWGSAAECEQTYGFLPCTTTALGNLFLVVVHGFLMYTSATYLSAGSEELLEILGPGIVGGLFLPILGALPDALLILFSGFSGSKETAQSQVLIGMGLLAGSTVMLLTVLWGSCVVVGKCDIAENQVAIDSQDTKGFSLHESGVSTDKLTSHAAKIMTTSVVPFIVVQFPKVLKTSHSQRIVVLISLILAILLVILYCSYQIFQPWVQKRKLAFAKHKHVISGILRHAQRQSLGKLLDAEGSPNIPIIKRLFRKIDLDNDGKLTRAELRSLVLGIQFDDIDLDRDDAVEKLMYDFDTSRNATIEEKEFINGMSKWILEAKRAVSYSGSDTMLVDAFHRRTAQEHQMLAVSDEAVEEVENPHWKIAQAIFLLVLGTVMAAVFADPLVDSVQNFSVASSIPSFFISFIFMPLATNSSEAVSSIIFAARKKQRTTSLTFSEIYGGVTMNNTLCLAVFLALVYLRGLTWDFSSEVLVILLVVVIMGIFTSFRTTFPLWTSAVAFLLYPLSLLIVYILDYFFGWS